MAKSSNKHISLEHLWEERLFGTEVPTIDWNRPISSEELQELLRLYPFIQMINSTPSWEEGVEPQFITTPCGWVVHDYGEAMSTSPGRYLYGYAPPEEGQDESGGTTGTGTIINKTYLTAEFMVNLAMEKGWPGIEIIAGTRFMLWAAWMAAQDRNYSLVGFEPTKDEKVKRDRVLRLRSTDFSPAPERKPRSIS